MKNLPFICFGKISGIELFIKLFWWTVLCIQMFWTNSSTSGYFRLAVKNKEFRYPIFILFCVFFGETIVFDKDFMYVFEFIFKKIKGTYLHMKRQIRSPLYSAKLKFWFLFGLKIGKFFFAYSAPSGALPVYGAFSH